MTCWVLLLSFWSSDKVGGFVAVVAVVAVVVVVIVVIVVFKWILSTYLWCLRSGEWIGR